MSREPHVCWCARPQEHGKKIMLATLIAAAEQVCVVLTPQDTERKLAVLQAALKGVQDA